MNAIYSITAYKIKSFKENFLFSLKRPINFTPEIKTPIVNDSNPMIFREALPELPENALTQDLLVLPKFDIQAPI
jgi:hypothetical protein